MGSRTKQITTTLKCRKKRSIYGNLLCSMAHQTGVPVESLGLQYFAVWDEALHHLLLTLRLPPQVLQSRVETAQDLRLFDVREPGLKKCLLRNAWNAWGDISLHSCREQCGDCGGGGLSLLTSPYPNFTYTDAADLMHSNSQQTVQNT